MSWQLLQGPMERLVAPASIIDEGPSPQAANEASVERQKKSSDSKES